MEDYKSNVDIDLVIPGLEYFIRYRLNSPKPTKPNEGSDEHLDSDFDFRFVNDDWRYATSTFIPKEGEVIDSLHLGVKP